MSSGRGCLLDASRSELSLGDFRLGIRRYPGLRGALSMKQRLLVVDDEENLRELYKLELEEEGYSVDTAANASDGLNKLGSRRYDAIILDLQMPGMHGIDLLQKIVTRDRQQPVILNTSYAFYQENYLAWHADAYVVKSSDTNELKQAIRNVLNGPL
jgi:DNA-binding response OmpR family regulator